MAHRHRSHRHPKALRILLIAPFPLVDTYVILRLIWHQELPAGAIAARFDVTRPAISQHLSILKDAGLVVERRAGTRRYYLARRGAFADLRTFLERFWDERLDRLRAEAEREERKRRRPGHGRG